MFNTNKSITKLTYYGDGKPWTPLFTGCRRL